MHSQPDRPQTLIVVAAEQRSFYEYVRPRQEADGRTLVVLDRRQGDRRRGASRVAPDRRNQERRVSTSTAALALLRVLGFAVLRREGDRYVA